MADYAIVIKACSKIVCHALSRIKTKAMLWILFSGFTGFLTVYLYLSFYVRQALLGYLLSIYTQFFSVRTVTNCKFHSKPKQRSLSVFLIIYFRVIQTDNYIFHISTLSIYTPVFSVRTITRCKFISGSDHIFHGYSNRHFSTYQHCLSHSTCTMIAIGHISNIIELAT